MTQLLSFHAFLYFFNLPFCTDFLPDLKHPYGINIVIYLLCLFCLFSFTVTILLLSNKMETENSVSFLCGHLA